MESISHSRKAVFASKQQSPLPVLLDFVPWAQENSPYESRTDHS